jgi:ubiquinone/menaquinone biosynthesis C-methylase UbiE
MLRPDRSPAVLLRDRRRGVTQDEAIALIGAAVASPGGTWADLGAGSGTFTRALASLLGERGVVHAVDRDSAALRELESLAERRRPGTATVVTRAGDFTTDLGLRDLDGVVIANALHFVPYDRQAAALTNVRRLVKGGGTIVVVEYDRRGANRWVPYPVSPGLLDSMAVAAGLAPPTRLASKPSRYSGTIYAASLGA